MIRRALAASLPLPTVFLAGMLLALLCGSLVATVQPGSASLGPVPSAIQQISQNAKIKALCEQILAGKLHVKSHQGEVRAVRQCKRDGW